MTTIAIKDGVVAFDSRVSDCDEVFPDGLDKVWFSKRHEAIFCGVGVVASWTQLGRALDQRAKLPWHDPSWTWKTADLPPLDSKSSFIVVERDGAIHYFDGDSWYPTRGSVSAAGSGSMAANAVMLSGGSAEEAIRIACQLDKHSGPPVNKLLLADIPQRRKRRKADGR